MKFASNLDHGDGLKNRKTLHTAKNSALDDAVYIWLMQRGSLGEPILGPVLCAKALVLKKSLGGPLDFKPGSRLAEQF